MTIYPLLIFLHVLGAVGMFAAWAAEAVTLQRLRQAATLEEARLGAQLLKKQGPMGPVAMLIALGTGIWIMVARWGHHPWMATALVAVALIVVTGIALGRRTALRLRAALSGGSDQFPGGFYDVTWPLVISHRLRVAMGVGILGLMTIKPGMAGSLAIMAAAVSIGLGMAIARPRRQASAVFR